jgi:hypothetical protein
MMGAATASAGESARPDNPSGFGQTAKVEAPVGELARTSAHNDWGPGAGAEVRMFREMNASMPHPQGTNQE